MNQKSSSDGIGCLGIIGIALAGIISYDINGSIMWALFHAWLSWFYVIYRLILGYHF